MPRLERRRESRPPAPDHRYLKHPIIIREWRLFFWFYVLVGAPIAIATAVFIVVDEASRPQPGWGSFLALMLFLLVPFSACALLPALRRQRRILLEVRAEGIWSPQTGTVPWERVRFLGFREYWRNARHWSTLLEVFVSSELMPDVIFDLDDTNIYWIGRLRRRLQCVTQVKVHKLSTRGYRSLDAPWKANGNTHAIAAASKVKVKAKAHDQRKRTSGHKRAALDEARLGAGSSTRKAMDYRTPAAAGKRRRTRGRGRRT